MKYLYTMTVNGERIKDSFLETVKNPISFKTKTLICNDIDGDIVRTAAVEIGKQFKPITLKMDICTGLELGQDITLKLYNKKTQSCMFTIQGTPQIIDRDKRTVKFYVKDGRVGI